MLGAALSLISAAFFGLNSATLRRAVLSGSVLQGMVLTVPLAVPFFAVAAWAFGGFAAMAEWRAASWGWMVLAGLVHFVIGRYANYAATQKLGVTLTTPVLQLSTLVSLGLAIAVLDETVNAVALIGIVLILVGPMMLVRRRGAVGRLAAAKGFRPDYRAGYGWAGLCALCFGISPLLIVLGLGEARSLADAAAGVLVSYLAASLVVIVAALWVGGDVTAREDARARGWFLASGALVGLSQLFRYMALAVAPVIVVAPIQRLSTVFRLLFNVMLNRDHEVLDGRVIASILLAVVGAVVLAMDTGVLLLWLGVPDAWRAALAAPLF